MKATPSPQSKGSRHPKNGSIKKNIAKNGSPTPTSPHHIQNPDMNIQGEKRNLPLTKKQKLHIKISQLEERLQELQSSAAPDMYSESESLANLNEQLAHQRQKLKELEKVEKINELRKLQIEEQEKLALIDNEKQEQIERLKQLQVIQNSPSPKGNANLTFSNQNDAVISIKSTETGQSGNKKNSPKRKLAKAKKSKNLEQLQQTQQLQKLQALQELQQKQQEKINELQKQKRSEIPEKEEPVSESINDSSFGAMNPVQAKQFAEKHFSNQSNRKPSKSSNAEIPVVQERGIDLEQPEEPKEHSINVHIIEINQIPDASPYCVIYTESKTMVPIKTKVLPKDGGKNIFDENYDITFNPQFNPKSAILVILVKKEDLIKGDKLIGFVRIDLNVALRKLDSSHKELDKWFPIMTESRIKTQSKIHIILRNTNSSVKQSESAASIPQSRENYSSEAKSSSNSNNNSPKGTRFAKPSPMVNVNLCSPRPNPTSPKYQKSSDSTPTHKESPPIKVESPPSKVESPPNKKESPPSKKNKGPKTYKKISPIKESSSQQKQESSINASNAPAPAALSDQNNKKIVSRSVSISSQLQPENEEVRPPQSPNKLQQQVGSLLTGFKPTNEPLADIASHTSQIEEESEQSEEDVQVCILAPSKCPIPVIKKLDPKGDEFGSLTLQEIIQRTGTPRVLTRDIELDEFEEEEEVANDDEQLEMITESEENIERKLERAFGKTVPENIEEHLNKAEKKGNSVVYNLTDIAKYYQPRIRNDDDDLGIKTRDILLDEETPKRKPRIMKIENVSEETDSSVFDLTKHLQNENSETKETDSEQFISKLSDEEDDENIQDEPLPEQIQINKKYVPKTESDEDDNDSSFNKNSSLNQSKNSALNNDSDSDSLQIFTYTQDHSTIKLELSPTVVSPSKHHGDAFYDNDDNNLDDENDGLDDTHEQTNHNEDENVIDTPVHKRKKHHSKSKKSGSHKNENQTTEVDIDIEIDGKSAV